MRSLAGIHFREATSADVPAIAECRREDETDAGVIDSRMGAYFDGRHHPQQALPPRAGYVALNNDVVIGYIAGHRTTRHGCSGEEQYLLVSPSYRRRGIATALLRLLAKWFAAQDAPRVCVPVAADSPPEAQPFYESLKASPIKRHWYGWEDIGVLIVDRESE
jgi:GNAT superfamily N-acetyltransferase